MRRAIQSMSQIGPGECFRMQIGTQPRVHSQHPTWRRAHLVSTMTSDPRILAPNPLQQRIVTFSMAASDATRRPAIRYSPPCRPRPGVLMAGAASELETMCNQLTSEGSPRCLALFPEQAKRIPRWLARAGLRGHSHLTGVASSVLVNGVPCHRRTPYTTAHGLHLQCYTSDRLRWAHLVVVIRELHAGLLEPCTAKLCKVHTNTNLEGRTI